MKKFFFSLSLLAVLALFATDVTAQIKTPSASPSAKFTTTVGLTDVAVEYSRPSMKGRTIFAADGLVPFGKVWRTGANSATKVTFADDVKVAGQDVKAGSYAVLTKPMAGEWTVMFFPYEKGSWSSYVEKTPAVTVQAKTKNLGASMETFLINVGKVTDKSAHIQFIWDDVMASVPMSVMVDERVMASIEKTLSGPTGGDYYNAGTYYHTAGKDLNQALTYVQKATKVAEPKFWQVRREALILADLGRTKEAVAAANLSKDLAMKAGNDDYVRMNEASIKEWTAKGGKAMGKKNAKMK
ncbi:MAG: DUF2911 domain-containing protein [Saprospiraceae bacterium]